MKMISKLSLAGAALAGGMMLITVGTYDAHRPVDVSGWVLVDGMPLAGANVFFLPESSDPAPPQNAPLPATTDSLGRYQLPTGAPPGGYRIVVKGYFDEASSGRIVTMGEEPLDQEQLAAASVSRTYRGTGRSQASAQPTRRPLPENYSSPSKSVLRMDVPSGGMKNAEINLSMTQVASRSEDSILR